ncbi:MAG TPA: sigma-70 family RNA polymerase sigma factor [Thermoanaerobaculia bacterium]|nr:sigma-70 family RNA polymerase sigma factor [Thermoanaerobaculia bacterium]
MPQTPGTGPSASRITQLLGEWRHGNERALDELVPLVYDELRRLARHYFNRERKRPTLETADLIHDAFVRLCDLQTVDWQDRVHFFAVASRIMRRILIDRARRRKNAKHGGGFAELRLDEVPDLAVERDAGLVALDEALIELEETDPTLARIVEMRFFGGLGHDEIAAVLGLSNPTVRRHWRLAKSWLHRRLSDAGGLHG